VWKTSTAKHYVGDIAFAGTVVGQLAFGYLSDRWSRTNSLLVSTIILIIFTALAAGSFYHGDAVGMFNILTAWRFFVSSSSLPLLLAFPLSEPFLIPGNRSVLASGGSIQPAA
jgi:MFS family permease